MEEFLRIRLGDCKYNHQSKCAHPSPYVILDSPNIFITDPGGEFPVKIALEDHDAHLAVSNPNGTTVCVVKTDNCLFNDDTKKCDCFVFSNDKFYSVEIKENSSGNRNKKRNKAVEQLTATFEFLIRSGIDLSPYEVKAIICFSRNDQYPIRASSNSQRAIFQSRFNASLEEGNVITI
ncbi:hypothetical protein F0L74_08600 [Chitinophaga agrisoli]|uniref:Uncharacterized protein n=1 Tax=Chitinophaga agrisoli TaxID=2607653 RepID=A0A5B2VU63_9BACT|nr:hypothetical protein [Chitinophaga agrisoli]KAA2242585.1 hypothetical protein F0L74_08600 [Chitinophaga agrisoli]